jgi:hypothetical protein
VSHLDPLGGIGEALSLQAGFSCCSSSVVFLRLLAFIVFHPRFHIRSGIYGVVEAQRATSDILHAHQQEE